MLNLPQIHADGEVQRWKDTVHSHLTGMTSSQQFNNKDDTPKSIREAPIAPNMN